MFEGGATHLRVEPRVCGWSHMFEGGAWEQGYT